MEKSSFFQNREGIQNIPRGGYAGKFSSRSSKFPPSLLGGEKFSTEVLLNDCVRQGLWKNQSSKSCIFDLWIWLQITEKYSDWHDFFCKISQILSSTTNIIHSRYHLAIHYFGQISCLLQSVSFNLDTNRPSTTSVESDICFKVLVTAINVDLSGLLAALIYV